MQSYAFFSNYQTFDNHIYDNFIYLTQIIFYLTQKACANREAWRTCSPMSEVQPRLDEVKSQKTQKLFIISHRSHRSHRSFSILQSFRLIFTKTLKTPCRERYACQRINAICCNPACVQAPSQPSNKYRYPFQGLFLIKEKPRKQAAHIPVFTVFPSVGLNHGCGCVEWCDSGVKACF